MKRILLSLIVFLCALLLKAGLGFCPEIGRWEDTEVLRISAPNEDALTLGTSTSEGGNLRIYRDSLGNSQFSIDADAGSTDTALNLYGEAYFQSNVGIGTATPAQELDVAGDVIADSIFADAGVSGVITFGGTGGTNNENLLMDFETSADTVGWNSTTGAFLIRLEDFSFQLDDSRSVAFGTGRDARFSWETVGLDNLKLGLDVGADTTSGYFNITERADVTHANRAPLSSSANPVLRMYSSDETVAGDYGEHYHDQADYNIATGAGAVKWTIAEGVGSLKMATYQDADWDDTETVALPDGAIGHGTLQAGVDGTMEGGIFAFYDDEPVLLAVSANVQEADEDNKLVIMDGNGTVVVKNQLGNDQVLTMVIWYFIP